MPAYNGIDKVNITMEKILVLRSGNESSGFYFDFIEYFVSAVVGRIKYKENRCEKLMSEYVTIGDEALAILIFENNFDTWKDMAKNNITKNSEVARKYTNGGSSKGDTASSRRYQGWSSEGIKRFNELFDLVKEDRQAPHAKLFEESFRQYCENGGANGKKKKMACTPLYEVVEVRHELWGEMDDDTEGCDVDTRMNMRSTEENSCDGEEKDEDDEEEVESNEDSENEAPHPHSTKSNKMVKRVAAI